MGEENHTNQKNPKINQTEPSKKPPGLSYFCELSLNAKFQRLCVSYISIQDSSLGKKKFMKKLLQKFFLEMYFR